MGSQLGISNRLMFAGFSLHSSHLVSPIRSDHKCMQRTFMQYMKSQNVAAALAKVTIPECLKSCSPGFDKSSLCFASISSLIQFYVFTVL